MNGLLVGLLFGAGLVLAWHGATWRPGLAARRSSRWQTALRDLVARAGVEAVTPAQVIAAAGGFSGFVFVASLAVSGSPPVSLAFGIFAGSAPLALLRWRARQRQAEFRELWPEIVDNLASGVRAGLALPEAIGQLGARGPEVLRPAFRRFAEDYRASGRFAESLDRLEATLADPAADRICEALRLAREVGGSDLGRVLRTLGNFLREDARTRAELETRQGWTVNAARLGVAAPWLVLALLSLHREAVRAYNSAAGVLVLAIGGGLSVVAYRVMLRIARLPEQRRVLR